MSFSYERDDFTIMLVCCFCTLISVNKNLQLITSFFPTITQISFILNFLLQTKTIETDRLTDVRIIS